MIVYLAGPITGVENYKDIFNRAAAALEDLGDKVINPATLPQGMPDNLYMPICLGMIKVADMVILLPGWDNSEGARLEKQFADYQKIKTMEIDLYIQERQADNIVKKYF